MLFFFGNSNKNLKGNKNFIGLKGPIKNGSKCWDKSAAQCLRVAVTQSIKTVEERGIEVQIRLLCFVLCVMSASLDTLDIIDM